MSYIQNNLQTGEEIKYKADIHWYIFVYPAILLLLGAFFSSAQTGFIYYIGLLLLLLGLFQLIKRVLLKIGAEYVVTNKKVILKSGILSRDALVLLRNPSGYYLRSNGTFVHHRDRNLFEAFPK